MSVACFLGPSLPLDAARPLLDAEYLPPAAQGDVLRVLRPGLRAVVLIDGLFERVPAVWHKELLLALEQGVTVLGAASMGALRAAELAAFGMEPVGWIAQAYLDGTLEADDEVAVLHAHAEDGYRCLTEALVNVRRTAAGARAAGIVSITQEAALVEAGRDLHYTERTWPAVLSRAGLPPATATALRRWLPRGRVDQKRTDAEVALRRAAALPAQAPARTPGNWRVARTQVFEQARTLAADEGGGGTPLDGVIEELQLTDAWFATQRAALLRALALAEARRGGDGVGGAGHSDDAASFRRSRGLDDAAAVAAWRAATDLDAQGFGRFVDEQVLVERVALRWEDAALRAVRDQLRAAGTYPAVVARARDKQARLAEAGLENPTLEDADIDGQALHAWYFREVLGLDATPDEMPAAEQWAAHAGFASPEAFRRAALRELCYRSRLADGSSL